MAIRISELSDPAAVLAAIQEYDDLGQATFLAKYGYKPARSYFLEVDGHQYDSKAIAGVAYGKQYPERGTPTWKDFSGGDATVAPALRALGFTVNETANPADAWALEPEDLIRRVDLHVKYGGRQRGGIGPSSKTPNVFIFSDPASGEQHGYFDRWEGDEFHYAGEGQHGNQTLDQGNAAILNHRDEGRALRVFWGTKGVVEYAGEFELDTVEPYYWVDAPSTAGGALRRVVTFRLHPVGTATATDPTRPNRRIVHPALATAYRTVDPSKSSAPRDPFEIDPAAVDRGLRGHAETQQQLAELARAHGFEPLSPGPGDPNFDLAWHSTNRVTVVEVKSLTAANEAGQIRLGLGQVLDYQHRLDRVGINVQPVLAVEHAPAGEHWLELCARHGALLVWPDTFGTLFAAT